MVQPKEEEMGKSRSRRADLREEAEQRAAERESRTPQQQLQRLDKLLGEGVGAKKERARLAKLIKA